nr:juvenile hormone acid O-methyltransferase-like [Onthophagus taurus]
MFNPNLYEKLHSPVVVTTKKILSDHGRLLNWPNKSKNRVESMKILDAGCGEGTSTVKIFQEFVMKNVENYKILGVDFSEQMILKAKEKYNDQKNCEFELMDLSLENFPEKFTENFDLIYSMYCLHWVQTTYWAKNFYKMLKPTGQIFLTAMTKNTFVEIFLMINQREKFRKYQTTVWDSPFFTNTNVGKLLKSILKEVGYKNIAINYDEINVKFPNEELLNAFIKNFQAFYDHFPTNLIDDYVNGVVDGFVKELKSDLSSSSSELNIKMPVILLYAEK